MIFESQPTDWRDLEAKVCQIFNECGCEARRNQTLETVRGPVNVDVAVNDRIRQPALLIICECKRWGTRVPRSVVHSFRTVIADAGAHLGYLISNSGFQSGAHTAAASSNVRLMTWEQFQLELYNRWFNAMLKRLEPFADEVFEYMDVYNERLMNAVDGKSERMAILMVIHSRYYLFTQATSYRRMMGEVVQFPLQAIEPGEYDGPDRNIIFDNARSYFDTMLAAAPQAVAAYERFIAAYTRA